MASGVGRSDSFNYGGLCNCSETTSRQKAGLIISLALVALCAVATYYCFKHGLSMLDRAVTKTEFFGAYCLLYCGAVGSVAAVSNFFIGVYAGCCDDTGRWYDDKFARKQILATLLGPIAFLPVILCGAAEEVLKRR